MRQKRNYLPHDAYTRGKLAGGTNAGKVVSPTPATVNTLVTRHEGLRLKAYKCPSGVWTIGYGHTGNVTKGMTITKQQALRLLAADLERFNHAVGSKVTYPLKPRQRKALVSFAFNVGESAFSRSSVVKHVNRGDFVAAGKALLLYVRDNKGRVLPGLQNRRINELMELLAT